MAAPGVVLRRPRAASCSTRSRGFPSTTSPGPSESSSRTTRPRSPPAPQADTLVELGAGTCDKSRVLLDAMEATGGLRRYVPLDVSDGTLWAAATALADEYPGLLVHAVVGDFHLHVDRVPSEGQRLVAFLGSTIGNLTPDQRRPLPLRPRLHDGPRGPAPARHRPGQGPGPAAGRLRRLPGGHRRLQPQRAARPQPRAARLVRPRRASSTSPCGTTRRSGSRCACARASDQVVSIADLSIDVTFAAGEDLLTEISSKFTRQGVQDELYAAGFLVDSMWEAPGGDFLLTLARPYC